MAQCIQTGRDHLHPHHFRHITYFYLPVRGQTITYLQQIKSLTATTFPLKVTASVFEMRGQYSQESARAVLLHMT
jgi:hypothetical protein